MVSDAKMNASIPNSTKDFGKKNRANRTAKLKKCKLDARREQWLSQAKNKVDKDEVKEVVGGFQDHGGEMRRKGGLSVKEWDVRRPGEEEVNGVVQHESDTESPVYSPSSGIGSESTFRGSSSSSSSFRSRRGSSSGSFSGEEVEEDGGDDGDGCLDDWEAVADALAAASDEKQASDGGKISAEGNNILVQQENACEMSHEGKKKSETLASGAPSSHAWGTDDAFRPQSLPNLSKQRSLPMKAEKHGGRGILPLGYGVLVPTSCPICCEDLDITDSIFLPCLCGFRLCLFCHKRILEDDGRCPGCRKPYDTAAIEKEANVRDNEVDCRCLLQLVYFGEKSDATRAVRGHATIALGLKLLYPR
ncbi:General negative regulator of transcription subunit 4-like protein, partial [Drosera capensis]